MAFLAVFGEGFWKRFLLLLKILADGFWKRALLLLKILAVVMAAGN